MIHRLTTVHDSPYPRHTTLLALVQDLTRQGRSEQQIETEVLGLIERGHVVLTGIFRANPQRATRQEFRDRRPPPPSPARLDLEEPIDSPQQEGDSR